MAVAFQTILHAKFDKRFIGHTDSSENLLDNPILIVLGVDLVSLFLQSFYFIHALYFLQIHPHADIYYLLFLY